MIAVIALLILLILFVGVIAFCLRSSSAPTPNAREIVFTDEDLVGDEDGEFLITVVGLMYCAENFKPGGIWGIVMPEPENPHDRNAVAIIATPGNKMGYVGREELEDYRDWSKGKPCVFVGFVREWKPGAYLSRVMAIKASSREGLITRIKKQQNYLKDFRPEDGVNYSPYIDWLDESNCK